MVKVKTCPCIALPPPDATLPPPPPLIPSSTVLLKTTPSTPPPVPISALITKDVPSILPPSKKPCPPPFIRGQVGRKFFSLAQPRSYMKIPDGCSLIIAGFRKPLPHEFVNVKHILLDPFGGVWTSRESSKSGVKKLIQVPSPRMSFPHTV